MNGAKFFLCNIITWLITSSVLLTRAEGRTNNSQISADHPRGLKILPGIRFSLTGNDVNIHVRVHDLLQETEVQAARSKKDKGNPLQKLGFMMMMTPFIMQILSLPGAIATIKISLLRSIMVAQLAIAIMFYNLIKSTQNSDVVVVHRPYYNKHYRNGYPDNVEDEWFGR